MTMTWKRILVAVAATTVSGAALLSVTGCASARTMDSSGSRPAVDPSAATRVATYEPEFSTYLGGASMEHIRGITVDARGCIYVTGGTGSPDFPTTPGVCQPQYAGGKCDVFVTKFSPAGEVLWSTLLGGPFYDRAYSVKVDKKGCVYVSGRAGPGFPVTGGVFQPTFGGSRPEQEGAYGDQNGFVAKLAPDGSKIVWASYVGAGDECRDMALDERGDIYLTLGYNESSTFTMPAEWFARASQKRPHGPQDCGVIKVSNDGTRVLWASFVGGSKGNGQDSSLCVGPDHCPILFMGTRSSDVPTTSGAFRRSAGSSWLGKLSADGSSLVFGTYIGDGGAPRTHAVAIDSRGNIFVGMPTPDKWPATSGAFQATFGGAKGDFGIARFSSAGALLAATYLGGSGCECNGPDTVLVDSADHVLIAGCTDSDDYPVTRGAFQAHGAGRYDGVLTVLSNDLSTVLYSTYMGGAGDDMLRACCVSPDGSICVAGCTGSPGPNDFPTKNAYQKTYGGLPGYVDLMRNWASGDCVVARLGSGSSSTSRPGRGSGS